MADAGKIAFPTEARMRAKLQNMHKPPARNTKLTCENHHDDCGSSIEGLVPSNTAARSSMFARYFGTGDREEMDMATYEYLYYQSTAFDSPDFLLDHLYGCAHPTMTNHVKHFDSIFEFTAYLKRQTPAAFASQGNPDSTLGDHLSPTLLDNEGGGCGGLVGRRGEPRVGSGRVRGMRREWTST